MSEFLLNIWRIIWFVLFAVPAIIWCGGILLTCAPAEDAERYIKRLLWAWTFGRDEYA